ncbi:hypothetical protein M5D96_006703 [Drosophila gunungcola]|uniref:Uncharacterized protein n=1 Tax=Drosophila gunungcola TaxID=103775 RepID=A0A9Q0BR24_9MUSC|nr:hypothetical protein M5D96_006703 [Drosophila gunungcola]
MGYGARGSVDGGLKLGTDRTDLNLEPNFRQLQPRPTLPICAGYCSSGFVLTQRVSSGQRSPLFRGPHLYYYFYPSCGCTHTRRWEKRTHLCIRDNGDGAHLLAGLACLSPPPRADLLNG